MKKYGRTFHLPISLGATSDDKIMSSLEGPMIEGKYVRANHVQSDTHWMKAELVPNRLLKN